MVHVMVSLVATDGDSMVAPDAARDEGRDHQDRQEEDEADEKGEDLLVPGSPLPDHQVFPFAGLEEQQQQHERREGQRIPCHA